MSMYIGEALVGDGNEVAHIDLLIGDKAGPVGVAFANALANQKQGHSNLLAVLAPNLGVKPATVMITKVTIKGAKQAVQNNEQDRQTLLEQGGKIQVPCLRIEEDGQSTWLYESKAISAYLHERFLPQ
jgi:hypothetical protein